MRKERELSFTHVSLVLLSLLLRPAGAFTWLKPSSHSLYVHHDKTPSDAPREREKPCQNGMQGRTQTAAVARHVEEAQEAKPSLRNSSAAAHLQTRPKPYVDSRQLGEEEARRRWPDTDFDVPRTLRAAMHTFFSHPTSLLILGGILGAGASRLLSNDPLEGADAFVASSTLVAWTIQEWAIHKWLLHERKGWYGHDIHSSHHAIPFYHVCIDPPELVIGWAICFVVPCLALLPQPLGMTAVSSYLTCGLLYEAAHYYAHIRVDINNGFLRAVKRHHMRHHLVDERRWLAFIAPIIDDIFGTGEALGGGAAEVAAREEQGAATE